MTRLDEVFGTHTVTLPPEIGAKHHQELLCRNDKWETVYYTLRNCIEGFNGYVKDGSHEALDDPERRRIRDVAVQSVFVALLLVVANPRKISAFLGELAGRLRRLLAAAAYPRREDLTASYGRSRH